MGRERILAWILRMSGGITLLAAPAVFMPVEWMAEAHRSLGLGDFPRMPIVDYLTRSISVLYAIHGGLCLVLASDVRRHARIILYLACSTLAFAVLLLGIDLHAGMPVFWTAAEGPPLFVLGLVEGALIWPVVREGRG